MKRKPNHKCKVCGKAYYACNDCDKINSWRSACDTPEHYQIFVTCILYRRGEISKDEAKEMLINSGASLNRNEYLSDIQLFLDEVMTESATETTGETGAFLVDSTGTESDSETQPIDEGS